jgi:hypothetical protein
MDQLMQIHMTNAHRYFTTFTKALSYKIIPKVCNKKVDFYSTKHFAERTVDRNLNSKFIGNLLAYICENLLQKIVDTKSGTHAIRYKDIVLVLETEKKENECRLRLATVLTDHMHKEELRIFEKKGALFNYEITLAQVIKYQPMCELMPANAPKKNY